MAPRAIRAGLGRAGASILDHNETYITRTLDCIRHIVHLHSLPTYMRPITIMPTLDQC